jgi:sterol 3beta-glucosyltransferase
MMKILLIGLGTRGDIQPLIALGNGLKSAGYEVGITAAENFQEWIEREGFQYEYFPLDMQAFMNSEHGKEWAGNSSDSPLKEAQNMRKMMGDLSVESCMILFKTSENYDVLVSGLTTFHITESIAQKLNKKHLTILLAPMNPTHAGYATLTPFVAGKSIFLNRISGYIGQYVMHWIFKDWVNEFRTAIGLPTLSYSGYLQAYNRDVPVIYGISPQVMPPPDDWDEQIYVTGFWFYDAGNDWTPSAELSQFLASGKPPVYIGFGSMSNKNPQATTDIMIDALQQSRQRGIIYSGWAGLQAEDLPDDIFLLDFAPHDWLFPQMAAVIHHGGAGTTAAGWRAGVPSGVVSHMADQPYWGRRVHELGVGAPLIRRHELTTERLAENIALMVNDAEMCDRAGVLGEQIRQEDGVARAVAVFNTILTC